MPSILDQLVVTECIFSLFNIMYSFYYKLHNYFITVNVQLFSKQTSIILIQPAIISKKIYHFHTDTKKEICNVYMFTCHMVVLPATTSAVHQPSSYRYYYGEDSWISVRVRVILWLAVYHQSVHLDTKPLVNHDQYSFQLNTCSYSPYVTSSLTRGWVCHLQLLLALTSSVILWSQSRRTHNHILLSQIWDSPNLEGQLPVFISPRNKMAQLYPQALGSLSSPPTAHRATVEVFDPASKRA
jgi:hypothetical protein